VEFILEIIGYFIKELILYYLVLVPGAFVLWLFTDRKMSFSVYKEENEISSFFFGLFMWMSILIAVYLL